MFKLRILLVLSALFLSFCFKSYGLLVSSKTVVIDNFDRGVFSNLLVGEINSKKTPPGVCVLDFISKEALTFGNSGSSLKVSFDVKEKNSFAFFWIKLAKEDSLGRIEGTDYLKECNYLSFWIRGEKGGESVKLELHQDANSDRRFNIKEDIASSVNLKDFLKNRISRDWKKLTVPLSAFKEIKDPTKILEIVFVFEHSGQDKNLGAIYIDELIFGRTEPSYLSREKPIQLNKPKLDTLRINRNRISDIGFLEGMTELSIDCDSILENPAIESVRFEYSKDNLIWKIIGFDYDTTDTNYNVKFDTFNLLADQGYYLRAIATYIDGGESKTEKVGPISVKELTDEEFLIKIEERAFNFFKENQSQNTGLFLDNIYNNYSSIASTGFGLAALTIGAKNGWIDKETARERAYKTIDTFLGEPKNKFEVAAEGNDGFYHFLDTNTAKRFGESEISTVDTAILVCGVIVCGEYFGGKVKEKADKLYRSIRWDKFLDKTSKEHKGQFYMGWFPDGKLLDSWWDYYTDEVMLLSLLAIGSTDYRVGPEVFYSFKKEKAAYAKGEPFIISWHGALFTYQYAHSFFDFRGLIDKEGIDWWRNSISATLANRNFCIDNSYRYKTLGPYSWGITSMRLRDEYTMHYGAYPCGSKKPIFDGTISPSGPAGSMPFTPFVSLDTLRYLLYHYPELWGRYGIKDSFNLDDNWYCGVYYGLGAGIILIMVENARTSFVWDTFMKNLNVQQAIELAGFKKVKIDEKPSKIKFAEEEFLREIKEADLDKLQGVFNRIWDEPKTESQFEHLINGLKDYCATLEDKTKTSFLNYLIAYTYLKEIENLRKDSTLDSFRRYLKNKSVYYSQANEIIIQLLRGDIEKKLKADLLFLNLLIDIGSYRFNKTEESLKKLATIISNYSDSPSLNILKLGRFSNILKEMNQQDYALKLKAEFIKLSQSEQASMVLERLREEARLKFDERDYQTSLNLYLLYFDIKSAKNIEDLQNELREVTDRFYSANKWQFARKLCQKILDIPISSLRNYAHFRIAKTLEAEAAFEEAVGEYEMLMKTPAPDEWSDKAYIELAKIYYTNSFKDINSSINKIRELIDVYPKNIETIRLKTYLAELYYTKKDLISSLKEYKLILEEYPESMLVA
ncbi:MAG: hypothetical protein FJZ16_04320, partial [Candidatus Omnitrophica bacterium]|nr:hypothetical protein [Candidatus Omnitrophota bacterium]